MTANDKPEEIVAEFLCIKVRRSLVLTQKLSSPADKDPGDTEPSIYQPLERTHTRMLYHHYTTPGTTNQLQATSNGRFFSPVTFDPPPYHGRKQVVGPLEIENAKEKVDWYKEHGPMPELSRYFHGVARHAEENDQNGGKDETANEDPR